MTTLNNTSLRFEGRPLDALLKGLWALLTFIPIVTTAWGVVPFARWFNENIVTHDGRRFSLEGQPRHVWLLMAGFTFAAFVQNAVQNAVTENGESGLVLLSLLLFVISQCFSWAVIKWIINHTRFDETTALRFTGSMLSFLGWMILYTVSILTIIGWAWVCAAFTRWACRHITAPGMTFVFTGRGHEVLWRCLLTVLGSLLLVTIPWLWVWLMQWFIASTHIEHNVDV